MKRPLFFCLMLVLFISSEAQNRSIIYGTTKSIKCGMVTMWHLALDELYSEKFIKDTVEVVDYHFQFECTLMYPQMFRLFFINEDERFISEPFFIDTGIQKIVIDSLRAEYDFKFNGLMVETDGSITNSEFKDTFSPLFDSINEGITTWLSQREQCHDSINSDAATTCEEHLYAQRSVLLRKRDSILLDYAIKYPNSKILLWQLSQLIWDFGYNNYYQQTFDRISNYTSPEISKSFRNYLNRNKSKTLGNVFPFVEFINKNVKDNFIQNNKYTLIEYWFSGCIPCIHQFNALRSIYEKNRNKGFEIVAISIDGLSSLNAYSKVLSQNKYPWKQVLDSAGIKANTIDINKFPTSFLLDNQGRIIHINIKPKKLEEFLKQQL